MDENVEVTKNDTVDDELEIVWCCLHLANPMSQLNLEELKQWVEADFPTEEILTDEATTTIGIKPESFENFQIQQFIQRYGNYDTPRHTKWLPKKRKREDYSKTISYSRFL